MRVLGCPRVSVRGPPAEATHAELARELGSPPYQLHRVRKLTRKVRHSSDRAVLTFEVHGVYKDAVSKRQETVRPWGPRYACWTSRYTTGEPF